jgi:hypothetical protein
MKKVLLNIFFISLVALVACDKDTKDPAPSTTSTTSTTGTNTTTGGNSNLGNLVVQFSHMVGNQGLNYNTGYKVMNGDSFTVTKFTYYISNIVLTKSDNSKYIVPNSYYIVDHANLASKSISLINIPAGNYKAIDFMLGVDSTISAGGSGAAVGALAQSGNMYWAWNSGYIMLKFEGTSPVSTVSGKKLIYHVGGYGGVNKAQRNYSFQFGATEAIVNGTASPSIRIDANVLELFVAPNAINFATLSTIHSPGTNAKLMADNYVDMFTLGGVFN